MKRFLFYCLLSFGFTLSIFALPSQTAQARNQAAINGNLKQAVKALKTKKARIIGGYRILGANFLQKLYAKNNYKPLWTSRDNIFELRKAIADSWQDGLSFEDFHAEALDIIRTPLGKRPLSATEKELLMSDAFVRILYQLFYGKVNPEKLDPRWNLERPLPSGHPVDLVTGAIKNRQVGTLIEKARPQHPVYQQLRQVLKHYTLTANSSKWPALPANLRLKPGQTHKNIPLLRKRMAIYTNQADPSPSSIIYDEILISRVKRFQKNHGLDIDGVIGPQTVKELNVTRQQRIDQIRVNMERARWAIRQLTKEKDLILVNIAGFYLLVLHDDKVVWETSVITGKPYHKTPVFVDDMEYVVFNPTWNVPSSIMRNEIFPKAKANPSYITRNNYKLVGKNGAVSPSAINWKGYSARSFPYRIVQKPGPRNALGKVKLIFPNKYNVYLHDTPGRSLFSKTGRAFSHGCIRVKNPLKLAEVVLANRNGWTKAKIDQAMRRPGPYRVYLKKKFPVAILYWTVDTNMDGDVRFYRDVYGRDKPLLDALNSKFQLRGG